VSDWTYVAAAFTIVWGSIAIYAIVLARRVSQARAVARALREGLDRQNRTLDQDAAACETPPVH
jgi:hypothetical protein